MYVRNSNSIRARQIFLYQSDLDKIREAAYCGDPDKLLGPLSVLILIRKRAAPDKKAAARAAYCADPEEKKKQLLRPCISWQKRAATLLLIKPILKP